MSAFRSIKQIPVLFPFHFGKAPFVVRGFARARLVAGILATILGETCAVAKFDLARTRNEKSFSGRIRTSFPNELRIGRRAIPGSLVEAGTCRHPRIEKSASTMAGAFPWLVVWLMRTGSTASKRRASATGQYANPRLPNHCKMRGKTKTNVCGIYLPYTNVQRVISCAISAKT